MDRVIIYPGQVPLETDLLQTNKFAMIALSKLAAAVFGTSTLVNGLAVVPTGPASLSVNVNAGEIYSLQNVDSTAYSSIAIDTHSVLKQGISLDAKNLACAAPGTVGQSINYLVQAAYADTDSGSVILPYYNASNPAIAYSGPNGSGAAQNTLRQGLVSVNAKAGVAATTGSQTTPAPDAGFVGLYAVTVANGQTTINAGNIAAFSGAPIISETLTQKISKATADTLYAASASVSSRIQSVSSAVAANALTLTYNGGNLDFRAAALPTGIPVQNVVVPALSVVVPSGASLGTVSGQQARLALIVAYNAGTPVACVVNLAGGVNLDETDLISPTTISAGATSAGVIYSASAVAANSPYRVVGVFTATEAAAGTWATAPSKAQGIGGQALAAMSSLGFGQTPQNVTASRAFATTYYNTTGKPMLVSIVSLQGTGSTVSMSVSINGATSYLFAASVLPSGNAQCSGQFLVPADASYSVTQAGSVPIGTWVETR